MLTLNERGFAKPAKILFSLAMKLYKYKHDPAPIRIYFTDKDAYGADQTGKKDLESGAICMSGKDPVGISGVFKSSPWDAF
jgi:hypothetical protein